jgi:hypothetical protein
MSFSDVYIYFRDKVNTAGPFKEIEKPFDQSIPSSIIDRSYSIVFERMSGVNRNMVDFQCLFSVYVNLYKKGFINELKTREAALADSEIIIKNCMKVVNANTQLSIKNVKIRTIDIAPIGSNDNSVVSRMNFDVNLRFDPNK